MGSLRLSFGEGLTIQDLDIDNPKAPFWLHLQKAAKGDRYWLLKTSKQLIWDPYLR